MKSKNKPLTFEQIQARKEKARWARILRVYGLTKEQYDELYEDSCPICLRPFDSNIKPVIDHDHIERRVRGIVCRYCNHRRIGHHRDPDLLRRMVDYLERPKLDHKMPPKIKRKRKKKNA